MSLGALTIAIVWGTVAGFLILWLIESLVGLAFCLHGIFLNRWKKLADKAATGIIKAGPILRLMLPLIIYSALCSFLFQTGNAYVQRKLEFHYHGYEAIGFGLGVLAIALFRTSTHLKKLRLIWNMTHVFDFAEKRQRTRVLKI